MNEYMFNLNDLSNTREFLERKVPNFMVIFIYIVFFLFFSFLAWMSVSEIDVVVKSNGVIRPNKNISIIKNINGGKLIEKNYAEGREVKKGEILYKIDNQSLQTQKVFLQSTLNEKLGEIESLLRLEESIKEDINKFSIDNIAFYNRYLSYATKKKQLELEYKQLNDKYEKEKKLGLKYVSSTRIIEIRDKLDYAKLNLEKFLSEAIFQIKSEYNKAELEKLQLESQLNELEKKIEFSEITAPITGEVQVINRYNINDYIPSGTEILKIIPKGTEFLIDINVDNKDISQIKEGQEAKLRLLAFPYKEYGMLEAEIIKISSDVTYKDNNLAYKVQGKVNNQKLYSKKGKEERIMAGMVSEVRIITRRKKILHIVLEKLDFIDI